MVQDNELRIGNYYKGNSRTFKMDARMMYAFMGFKEPYTLENIDPIELTPEILEACGFKQSEDKSGWEDDENDVYYWATDCIIHKSESGYYYFVDASDPYYSTDLVKLEYLHQLQNLYFALVGKELTIKFKELV